ncbi:hypothetical protein [Candidatus Reidiella endopervernicosa]|uniref:Uncharacterized protein n=1 Tax=Candidatus Reidiella endopervernicosa TaxID=2738883 RepID=A0A6N0HWV2_9GAMM|nr:hypothetical protein [Candidatus Reidiella endopervernicosa]QKQ26863.1 hypothetical protein HUE57_11675 [Candidatus Reidiella endopervernicosa]
MSKAARSASPNCVAVQPSFDLPQRLTHRRMPLIDIPLRTVRRPFVGTKIVEVPHPLTAMESEVRAVISPR